MAYIEHDFPIEGLNKIARRVICRGVKEDRRHDLARRIERLDAEIDALVYELYGLTGEEIAIVED
jgi:hypothetical protein